jgi:alpha-L-fucosidase
MNGMNKYQDAAGDFGTPEQEILEGTSNLDWESCMTMNDTWGYKLNDNKWKSSKVLIDNLIDIAAKGGNYLLNVGPTATGIIPEESVERLEDMGEWLKINGEAVYATNSLKQYKEGNNIKFTTSKSGKFVYAMVTAKSSDSLSITSVVPVEGSKVYMLGSKKPLKWFTDNGKTVFVLPKKLPGEFAWTIKIPVVQ